MFFPLPRRPDRGVPAPQGVARGEAGGALAVFEGGLSSRVVVFLQVYFLSSLVNVQGEEGAREHVVGAAHAEVLVNAIDVDACAFEPLA